MQPIAWYVNRLRCMSPVEVRWRLTASLRSLVDRPRVALGLWPRLPRADAPMGAPAFRVSDVLPGEWAGPGGPADEADWARRLVDQADRIAAHRLSFFGLGDVFLGDPIDWNRDHASDRPAPVGFAPSIDYRDFRVTGDAKVVWEPNRHHHLVVLARAYRASGKACYAAAVIRQLQSWLDQCPFGRGMAWRSPLELALRLINWVWALDLIHESGAGSSGFHARVREAVFLHVWEIARKYSRGSSANNHLIGEAAGVFVATSYFPDLPGAARLRAESRSILCQEILAQTHPDGGGREQALGYHLFVLQFFVVAWVVARAAGDEFPAAYRARVEAMLNFAGAFLEGGGSPPTFGDSDDGYVLDLGGPPRDPRPWLAAGAVLLGRADFKAWAGEYAETARWLLGRESRAAFLAIRSEPRSPRLRSRAFPDTGYYLLQCGRLGERDAISVGVDCAELGFGQLAAHGHADALSVTLRAFGADVLIDPGTYDYFSFPAWREYFRSTRAHNTVEVDGSDQSVMLGPFLWGERARARCLEWAVFPEAGGRVVGEHDGYRRLADPVVHRRTVTLDGVKRVVTIQDDLRGRGPHRAALHFHFGEGCSMRRADTNRYEIDVAGGRIVLHFEPGLEVETVHGSENPIGGWRSHGYHRKIPITTIVARSTWRDLATWVSRFEIGPGDEGEP
jgi:Heparinase II/III-like protein/Heparinase II/III N-terminus